VQTRQYTDPSQIEKLLLLAMDQSSRPQNVVIECLKRRMPLHFGGMSDPFLIPCSYRNITLEILKVLDRNKYPTLISTKANIASNTEFADIVLGKPHFAFQISFSTFNDDIASVVEPNAPLPSKRLEGAKLGLRSGNWVACRLQPHIPGQDIGNLVSSIGSVGFKHITFEHLKLPFENNIDIDVLSSLFGIDILSLFLKDKKIKRGREFEMPTDIRLAGIEAFLSAGRRHAIPIGVGDNGFQHLSSSECCCGIDSVPGFENWFKHNITVALRRVGPDNTISYRSIAEEWAPESDITRMINSKTRLRACVNTVRNQIKMHWDCNRQFSPSMFFNVVSKRTRGGYIYYLKR
jgi:hypothetical protein